MRAWELSAGVTNKFTQRLKSTPRKKLGDMQMSSEFENLSK